MSIALEISLDGDERLPLYQRLADAIQSKIAEGGNKPGDKIPSENEFAEELGLAAGTVRQALARLVDDGVLERKHGKGTFVRAPDFEQSMFRFFRVFGEEGKRVKPQGLIVDRQVKEVPENVALSLQVVKGSQALNIQRLRKFENKSVMIEDIWLPLPEFQNLVEVPNDSLEPLLYPAYSEFCGCNIFRAEEIITISMADKIVSDTLQMDVGEPVVVIERLAFGYEGKPLEWRRSRGSASQFQYHVEIR